MLGDKVRTSIQVTVQTRSRLMYIGRKGDSYNDIIERLLDEPRVTTIPEPDWRTRMKGDIA